MRLMLHACCGPCSLEPVRIFSEAGVELAIDYANPNIHPAQEYRRRLSTLREHVTGPQGIPLYEEAYDPSAWQRAAGVHGTREPDRCRACYRLRLETAAARAVREGFDALSTTLTISPYQHTDIIFEELERAAASCGLHAVCRDFRSSYARGTARSRELGMYRQNYCGCGYSMTQAQRERDERKAQRAAAKEQRHRALIWAAAEGAVNQASQL